MAATAIKNKAKDTTEKVGDFISENGTTLLVVAAVGVGGYLLYRLAANAGNLVNNVGQALDGDDGSKAGEMNPGGFGGSKTTITPNQASNIAAQLMVAFNYIWGTDLDAVFNLLGGLTPADYALVSNAFGKPRYNGIEISTWPFPKATLSEVLAMELSTSEMKHLRQIMPGVL